MGLDAAVVQLPEAVASFAARLGEVSDLVGVQSGPFPLAGVAGFLGGGGEGGENECGQSEEAEADPVFAGED